jgi:glycosyltransferase involved in cell wall biosynthesis
MPADAPRRVLYVQPNNEVGGSDIALLRLVSALDRTRYTPVVVLPGDGPLSDLMRKAGAELRFSPMRQLRTVPSPGYQLAYLAGIAPTVVRLRRLIHQDRIAFVHTNSLFSFYGAWAARLAGRPHVWHVREIPPAVPVARPAYARMVLGLSEIVVAMTRACVGGLFGQGPSPAKVTVLDEGLDLSRWHAGISGARIRAELGLAPDVPVVGFIARLDPWKGLDVFLRMARLVADAVPATVFLVIGDAPPGMEAHRDDMKALAASLGLGERVHFLGWRYRLDAIPEVMAALTLLCHTPVQPEPFGLVVIEAMAVGCPVVAPRAGGPAEIIDDEETGLLAPMGDPAGFAERVIRLLTDAPRRAALADAARRRVAERFATDRFAANLSRLYAGISGEGR